MSLESVTLTAAGTGAPFTVRYDEIESSVAHSVTPEDYGFHLVKGGAKASDRFEYFYDHSINEDGTLLTLAGKDKPVLVLHTPLEIDDAKRGNVESLYMDSGVKGRMLSVGHGVQGESPITHYAVGFGQGGALRAATGLLITEKMPVATVLANLVVQPKTDDRKELRELERLLGTGPVPQGDGDSRPTAL